VDDIFKGIRFDFRWSLDRLWALDISSEEMEISDLDWHIELPFWDYNGGSYNLKPVDVLINPKKYPEEYNKILEADTTYPIDIMENKDKWVILDGLHRLCKLSYHRYRYIFVRKIPRKYIDTIKLI